jgi:hypothetical protein
MYDIDPNRRLNVLIDVEVNSVGNCRLSKTTWYPVHFDIFDEKVNQRLIQKNSYLFNSFLCPSGICDKNPSATAALPIVVSFDDENRLHK